MKAAYYTHQGKAKEVLKVEDVDEVLPKLGEIQIQIHYLGVNPGEVKKRSDAFGTGMPYDLIIPHSDGAGVVRKVGDGVDRSWIGKRVLCFGAQSYRQFGTAAEYCCVPVENVVEINQQIDIRQAAQMGIPGITAHRAVHIGSPGSRNRLDGKILLVQGGNGAVGQCAIVLAKQAGAHVIASVRRQKDIETVKSLGAQEVYVADECITEKVLNDYPKGVDHIIEVAFAMNIETDVELLKQGGSIAAYATHEEKSAIPFWPLVFSNITIHFLGSDDFPHETKIAAAEDISNALATGWLGLPIGREYSLDEIAEAHLHVEQRKPGRALVKIRGFSEQDLEP